MSIFRRNGSVFLALVALLFASLACNFASRSSPGSTTPLASEPPMQVPANQTPTQAALVEQTPAAQAVPTTPGKITVTLDEAQLTQMITSELNQRSEQVLKDPQVKLNDGKITITGQVQQSGLSLPLEAVITVEVVGQGTLHYTVISANLGPLPLSQDVLDQLSNQLNSALSDPLSSSGTDMVIESVTIGSGNMTVTGHLR